MQGVRHAGPREVRASAPGGSDSIVSETFAPLVRLLGRKSRLGVQDPQPAASKALPMAQTRTTGVMLLRPPSPRARTIRGGRFACNQNPGVWASADRQQFTVSD